MSDAPSKSSITIKKYANRRLYNTATSSYVTLEDLSQMVKEGIEFNVFDAKTSEDITRSVLTQVIVEEEGKSGQQNLLPIGFLRQLIAFYGDSLQWMVPKYLEHSMEALTGNQDQIRNYFQTTIGNLFPFGTTLEDMSKQNLAMFERTMRLFTPFNMETLCDANAMSAMVKSATNTQTNTTSKSDTSNKKSNEKKTETKTESKQEQPAQTASVTNLKPRVENNKTSDAVAAVKTSSASTQQSNTPMPSVQNAAAASGADDMQQKIANLQRQLADLAKSRA